MCGIGRERSTCYGVWCQVPVIGAALRLRGIHVVRATFKVVLVMRRLYVQGSDVELVQEGNLSEIKVYLDIQNLTLNLFKTKMFLNVSR